MTDFENYLARIFFEKADDIPPELWTAFLRWYDSVNLRDASDFLQNEKRSW